MKSMGYIVVTTWYPTDIMDEVVDTYFEVLKQMPFDRSLGKETIQVAVTSDKKGIKTMSISEVKEGKLEEALAWVSKRLVPLQRIKGFECKARIWSTVIEALENIGRSLPG